MNPCAAPAPDTDDFHKWFPGLPLSRTACERPRWRVLCFPNAGNAEDMYTSEGTGPRRAPSPLLARPSAPAPPPSLHTPRPTRDKAVLLACTRTREWCRANGAECLAVQAPGRLLRGREAPLTRAADVAAALLLVLAPRLRDGVPYAVIGHSAGTWVAFELLRAAVAAGLPPPRAAFLSAMPAPDLPAPQRPWRAQRGLSEAEFKEECRGWDVNEAVFSAALWPVYQPLMRADFTLFDEYEFRAAAPFGFPITVFYGSADRRVTEAHVRGWARFTTSGFDCRRVEGHHLWPLQRGPKAVWLQAIADGLSDIAGEAAAAEAAAV